MRASKPVKACVFDAYGTLFDLAAPVAAAAKELGDRASSIASQWRTKQLEYSWLRSLMGRYVDFAQVTADSLDYTLAAHGLSGSPVREQLLASFKELKAYPDAQACLESLRAAGARTGILSNGSPPMLAAAVASAKLGALFDYILSVDTVQIYKPSPKVYELATNAFGVEAGEIAFVSGNAWDCAGASSFGFQVIHINRVQQPDERLGSGPHAHAASLTEAAALISKLLR